MDKSPYTLLTDLYELTMAYGYFKEDKADREAVFQLFFRKDPFGGPFAICAGIQPAIDFIKNFSFSSSDLAYLAQIPARDGSRLFPDEFLEELKEAKLSVDVDAMPEGSVVFPYEPILRVQGPIWQAQLLESILLNMINFQTLIATKGARVAYAAAGDHVVEFGLRRAQGVDGAISASRAAYIGGCDSTSNVLAGKIYGIPVVGTLAHSWVMSFEDEKKSFEAFAKTFPKNCIFLIDTYDTLAGVDKAIEVAKSGVELIGVRLDSGDLAYLSREVRKRLDAAGLQETLIMATNELDENIIADLKHQGATINMWGVGTNLVTGRPQPALDGVYKLTAVQDKTGTWQDRLKVSEQVIKTTHPGISQVRRYFDGGKAVCDMLYDVKRGAGDKPSIIHHTDPGAVKKVQASWESEDLLIPMMRKGEIVYDFPSLTQMRENTQKQLKRFDERMRRFLNPQTYFAGMEQGLYRHKIEMIEAIKG